MLQSQANQHEEILAATLAHSEEKDKIISQLKYTLETQKVENETIVQTLKMDR